MKKVIVVFAAAILSMSAAFAQDLAQTTEMFNNAATTLNAGDKASALDQFKAVLPVAEALGEAGTEIVNNCKKYIPQLTLSLAKDAYKDADFAGALAKLNEAVAIADKYSDAETLSDAQSLIPQILVQQGNDKLQSKDFAGAAEAYKAALESDPTNGLASLRLGMALSGTGDNDGAIAAFKVAAENGQADAAKKQMSTLYLKQAAASLKAKDFKGALDSAKESCSYLPTANAYKIAGTAAAQLKDYKAAADYFTKYLELSPNASDAATIKANIEAFKKL